MISKMLPFRSKKNEVKTNVGEMIKAMARTANPSTPATVISMHAYKFAKKMADDIVDMSGAFQEKEGEKTSKKTKAFVTAQVVGGFAGVLMLGNYISQGNGYLMIPITIAVVIAGLANKFK
jgi:hypothetical protein